MGLPPLQLCGMCMVPAGFVSAVLQLPHAQAERAVKGRLNADGSRKSVFERLEYPPGCPPADLPPRQVRAPSCRAPRQALPSVSCSHHCHRRTPCAHVSWRGSA